MKKFYLATILFVGIFIILGMNANAGQDKVDVCHITGMSYVDYDAEGTSSSSQPVSYGHIITIADPAYDSHIAHGDPPVHQIAYIGGEEVCIALQCPLPGWMETLDAIDDWQSAIACEESPLCQAIEGNLTHGGTAAIVNGVDWATGASITFEILGLCDDSQTYPSECPATPEEQENLSWEFGYSYNVEGDVAPTQYKAVYGDGLASSPQETSCTCVGNGYQTCECLITKDEWMACAAAVRRRIEEGERDDCHCVEVVPVSSDPVEWDKEDLDALMQTIYQVKVGTALPDDSYDVSHYLDCSSTSAQELTILWDDLTSTGAAALYNYGCAELARAQFWSGEPGFDCTASYQQVYDALKELEIYGPQILEVRQCLEGQQ